MLRLKPPKKMRGISLLETLLSLTIGGIVIVSSVQGVVTYNENVKIQASSALLNKMKSAADLYAEDNFDNLVANAPQTLPVRVLDPYLGSSIVRDPFKSNYQLATRTYTYTTPDPVSGGTITQDALQMLVMVRRPGVDTQLDTDPQIRIDIANTAGADTGFVSQMDDLCRDRNNNPMPTGSLCGSYGSFAFPANAFPGLNNNIAYAAIITKGDSSVYGDQLYRYNYGDPELNTMHTTLNMSGNDIINATTVQDTELLEMAGNRSRITNPDGEISIRSQGNLFIGASNNNIVLTNDGSGNDPRISSVTNRIQVGAGASEVVLGDLSSERITAPGEGAGVPAVDSTTTIGTGTIRTEEIFGDKARLSELNSLHEVAQDPLRLQNFRKGEVIIGQRARYLPPGGLATASSFYELSDGQITAGIVKTQDITCADCGGNLSDILPRWRHMGTYLIRNQTTYQSVPKPKCNINRRDEPFRPPVGDEQRVANNGRDPRYNPRILLLPKRVKTLSQTSIEAANINLDLHAKSSGNSWRVYLHHQDDNVNVEAFALTYCVFVGGPEQELYPDNPGNTVYATRTDLSAFDPSGVGGNWTVLP